MKIRLFQFNPIAENTYILHDETNECVIIDAGCYFHDEKEALLNYILDNNLVVKHLLNTHLHFDHILGNAFVKEQFGLDTEAHEADQFLLDGFQAQMRMFGFEPLAENPRIGKYLKEGDKVTFGNQVLDILHVPGHSPGSICFYDAKEGCVFAGDALFRGSIGRTDLAGGDHRQLVEAIHEKLLTLPPETVVRPGHGPRTTIKDEIENNPFL